jgi:hypothetical protein
VVYPLGPYCTDVSDDDWEKVRPWLLEREGPNASEEATRAAVNALLYREKTGLGWNLLPDDLMAAREARAYEARWRADGTWERLQREGGFRLRVGWRHFVLKGLRGVKRLARILLRHVPLLRRVKSQVGYLLRRAQDYYLAWRNPGPEAFAAPGAAPAERDAERANWAEIQRLGRVLALDPWHVGAYLRRCLVWQQLGRCDEACRDGWRCLALPGCRGRLLAVAHEFLARALLARKQIDRALVHTFQFLWLQRTGSVDSRVLQGEPAEDARGLQTWIEAHDYLAEEAINRLGTFDPALELYRRKKPLQQQFATRFGIDRRTLYLPDDWVRNIGHSALLDFWVKMARLGWQAWNEMILVAPLAGTANAHYLSYWKPYLTVIDRPDLINRFRPWSQALGSRVAGLLDLPDGRSLYFCEGMGAIQKEWERQGRAPLLSLTPADRAFGQGILRRLGVPDGAWFVSLHVRTPGFHKEGDNQFNAHRNADVHTYLPAIREIVRQGGWVLRLGDASMPPLPKMEGLIDYARSRHKSPRMDVFLCGACRFFMGVASGMTHVPTTFGVPCAITNWLSNAPPRLRKPRPLPAQVTLEPKGRPALEF